MEIAQGQDPSTEIEIIIDDKGIIGCTPTVSVIAANRGFDWDAGRVMLQPSIPLRRS